MPEHSAGESSLFAESLHIGQLSMVATMLNQGLPDEEVVEKIIAETRIAAGDRGCNWEWDLEERKIRSMIANHHKKFDSTRPDSASLH